MFERESRLFELANTVCSVDDGAGDVGGGGGTVDAGGGDAGGADMGGDTGGDAGVDAAAGDGAVDVQDPNGGAGEEPGADAVEPDPAHALTPEAVEQLVQQRLEQYAQQAQQQQEPPPYIKQILEQQAQQQQMYAQMMQQAQMAAQRRALEESRPKPPPPDATVEQVLDYQRRESAWNQQQQFGRLEQSFKQYTQALEQKLTALNQRFEQATMQASRAAYEAQTGAKLQQLAKAPGMQWVQKPGAQAVLRTVHQVLSEANPNISLEQAASMVAQEFGLGAPTQSMKNAARRDQATEALKQQRAQVQKRGGPMPAANAARTTALPKGKVEAVKQAIAAGAKLPQELKDLYGIH